ncbi:MAG TPA: hypothetical protein VFZ93_08940, partial [Albitalea sp.]
MDRDLAPLSVPAPATAGVATHQAPRLAPLGARERDASPWLGRDTPPSDAFLAYQRLERDVSLWSGAVPGAAIAPSTAVNAFMDWWMHLAGSTAKQWELLQYGAEQWVRAWRAAATGETV